MGDDNVGHCEWGDRMNMCLILSVYRDKLFEYADLTPSGFCLRGWMESEVLQKKDGYTRRITRF